MLRRMGGRAPGGGRSPRCCTARTASASGSRAAAASSPPCRGAAGVLSLCLDEPDDVLYHPRLVDDHGDPADHRRDEEPRHDALLRPEVDDPQPPGGFGGGWHDGRRHWHDDLPIMQSCRLNGQSAF